MIDLFETRTMVEALDQMLPAASFLKRTFFTRQNQFDTEHVDIDIRKGKRRLAGYSNPKAEATKVDRIGYITNSYKPPTLKHKMTTDAQDFLKRNKGEHIYLGNQSAASRAASNLGEDLATMDEMITRREEFQAAELLQSGTVFISGEGIADQTIDYDMPAGNQIVLAGTDTWDDPLSRPLEDLRNIRRVIKKASGKVPSDAIMGEDALDAFLDNESVKDQLDTRRIDLGGIDPQSFPEGAILYGRIKDVNMTLWSYDEWYADPTTGVDTALIDPKLVIIASRSARTSVNYGAIEDIEASASVPRFAKSWVTKDPSARWLLVQAAVLLALHQADAFGTIKVLA